MNENDEAALVGYRVMSGALAEFGQGGFTDERAIYLALCSILAPYTSQPTDVGLELLAHRLSGVASCLKTHTQLAMGLYPNSIFNVVNTKEPYHGSQH